MYEERRARPSWGEEPSPLFFAAYAAGQLPKVSRLNDGFMRPAFPAQVSLSYYLASMVGEMIEQEKGIAAIRGMLDGYRRGLTTERVFRDVQMSWPTAARRRRAGRRTRTARRAVWPRRAPMRGCGTRRSTRWPPVGGPAAKAS